MSYFQKRYQKKHTNPLMSANLVMQTSNDRHNRPRIMLLTRLTGL